MGRKSSSICNHIEIVSLNLIRITMTMEMKRRVHLRTFKTKQMNITQIATTTVAVTMSMAVCQNHKEAIND